MIRPFTLLCMLLACGAGLYLYQTKHRVALLDRDIAQTVQMTSAARDRAGVLRTEWTLLNDLERLRALSDQYLPLRPVAPGQFTSLADLGGRLPAPRAEQPAPAAEPAPVAESVPMADAAPADPQAGASTELADLPTPPVPPAFPPLGPPLAQVASIQNSASQITAREMASRAASREAALARAAEHRQLAEAAPRAQTVPAPMDRSVYRPVAAVMMAQVRAQARVPGRAVVPAPENVASPQVSSLGMATRTLMPPPVPVSAYQYTGPN